MNVWVCVYLYVCSRGLITFEGDLCASVEKKEFPVFVTF